MAERYQMVLVCGFMCVVGTCSKSLENLGRKIEMPSEHRKKVRMLKHEISLAKHWYIIYAQLRHEAAGERDDEFCEYGRKMEKESRRLGRSKAELDALWRSKP